MNPSRAMKVTMIILIAYLIVLTWFVKQSAISSIPTEVLDGINTIKSEQAQIQASIEELRKQYVFAEEQLYAQNLLIWDIRSRVHLDLGWELDNEEWTVPIWEEAQ